MMKAKYYIIKGAAELQFKKGYFDVIGQFVQAGTNINIPEGKSIIVECKSDGSHFDVINKSDSALVSPMKNSPYPPEWEVLIKTILQNKLQRILLLGEMDTGKTFLCTYLANRILQEHLNVSVIDCDLGQSDIGPPGCIGVSNLKKPLIFMSDAYADGLFFVGAHSPEGNLTSMLVGLEQLTRKFVPSSNYLFLDTCGWTMGDGARILKNAKISLLQPDLIILLQRKNELEHLVASFPGCNVFRLNVSKKSNPTDQMVRQQLRENISKAYFTDSSKISIPFEKFRTLGSYFKTGTKISKLGNISLLYGEKYPGYEGYLIVPQTQLNAKQLQEIQNAYANCRVFYPGDEKGWLVGLLNSKMETCGLGIVDIIDFKRQKIVILTPFKERSRISVIHFGSLKYNGDGSEAGFMTPGKF